MTALIPPSNDVAVFKVLETRGLEEQRKFKTGHGVGGAVFNARPIAVRGLGDAERLVRAIGCDEGGVPIMGPKALHHVIRLEGVDSRAALIIKQEMLAAGGEAAVCRGVIGLSSRKTDVVVMGTRRQLTIALEKLRNQPFGASRVAEEVDGVLRALDRGRNFTLVAGGKRLKLGEKTHVMGVLNVTPDSFSDGGLYLDAKKAVERGVQMVEEGADIIDVGGESTRPGAAPVPASEERRRVVPVIKALAERVSVPISIDTKKPAVAAEALDAGASIINDVSGLRRGEMVSLAASRGAPVVIMHMRGTPSTMQRNPVYRDVVGEICLFLRRRIERAVMKGVDPEAIIIDPGIGFGKTAEHNLEILARLGEFRGLGRPILVGASRKSFIGKILDLPVEERLEGSLSAAVVAILNGAAIIRAHDVAASVRATRVADAILRSAGG
ncbi:MAG: dihydropteroate synthase [Thermoplasmata archaeon]